MAQKRDYYEVLGISSDEKKLQGDEFTKILKKKYRDLAKKYHPDTHPDDKDAEEKFKEAAEAYEILNDQKKRQQYDQFGFDGMNGFNGFSGGGMSMEDIMRMMARDFGEDFGFGSHFGNPFGGRMRQEVKQRGSDLRIRVKLTLNEIATGCTKKIKLKRMVPCPDCNGSGSQDGSFEKCPYCNGTGQEVKVQRFGGFGVSQTITTCSHCHGTGTIIKNKCNKCNGTGLILQEEVINLNIPKGIVGGMQIPMEGLGNYGEHGGEAGYLIVVVEEEKDSRFERDDWDLVYKLDLPIPTAILGGKAVIPTLDKDVTINISKGTQPGKILRLAGKGLPKINQYGQNIGNGDLLIQINMNIPTTLTKEETDLLNKLKECPHFK